MVSVIVPSYNRRILLLRAVRSALDQTLRPEEIIVVDDCSEIPVENVLPSDVRSQITIRRNKQRLGAARSRNIGVNLARGRLIAFLDSDDYWLREKLQRQVALFAAEPALDMVYCDQIVRAGNGRYRDSGKTMIRGALLEHLRSGWTAPNTSTLIIRKESFRRIGGFDSELQSCQDHDLWMKAAIHKLNVDFVAEPLSVFSWVSKDRITLNVESRLSGMHQFLRKWKGLISEYEGFNGYLIFAMRYFTQVVPSLCAHEAGHKRILEVLYLFLRYLIYNPAFYARLCRKVRQKGPIEVK